MAAPSNLGRLRTVRRISRRNSQGRQIGVGGGRGHEMRVEGDGGVNSATGFREIPALAGITTKIKLDRGLLRVAKFGLAQDGLGLVKGNRTSGSVGKCDPPICELRLAAREFAGGGAKFNPA